MSPQTAAEETGIPAGLPVIAASNDKACEILGAGCLTPDRACISFGTTATINTQNRSTSSCGRSCRRTRRRSPAVSTRRSVVRGLWMVSWFKEEFGLQERLRRRKTEVAPEALLDELLNDVPPGAWAWYCQPYWTPGPEHVVVRQGRDHRLRRHPHPRPPLPRHHRRPGVRAQGGRGADREEEPRADHASARDRRRLEERRDHADYRRRFRASRPATAHARDLGGRRRHRCRRRPEALSGLRARGRRDDAGAGSVRADREATWSSTGRSTSASI